MAQLQYTDGDGVRQTIEGLSHTVDKQGRHYIWAKQLECNITYGTKGSLENALLSAIDSLLFMLELRDKRLDELQKIKELALQFAEAVNPPEEEY